MRTTAFRIVVAAIVLLAGLAPAVARADTSFFPPGKYQGTFSIKGVKQCSAQTNPMDFFGGDYLTDIYLIADGNSVTIVLSNYPVNTDASDYFESKAGTLSVSGNKVVGGVHDKSLYAFNLTFERKADRSFDGHGTWTIQDECAAHSPAYQATVSLQPMEVAAPPVDCKEMNFAYPTTPPNTFELHDAGHFAPSVPGQTNSDAPTTPIVTWSPAGCTVPADNRLHFYMASRLSPDQSSRRGYMNPPVYEAVPADTYKLDERTGAFSPIQPGEFEVYGSWKRGSEKVDVHVVGVPCSGLMLVPYTKFPGNYSISASTISVAAGTRLLFESKWLPTGCKRPKTWPEVEVRDPLVGSATYSPTIVTLVGLGPGKSILEVILAGAVVHTVAFTVTGPPCEEMKLAVKPSRIARGETASAEVAHLPYGCTPSTYPVTFASEAPSIAETSANGEFKAVAERGDAAVSARQGFLKATAILHVEPKARCEEIALSYAPNRILVGTKSAAPNVVITPADCDREQAKLQFRIGAGAASVDTNGVVQAGQAAGHIEVGANLGNLSATTEIDAVASPCERFKSHIKWLQDGIARDEASRNAVVATIKSDTDKIPAAEAAVTAAQNTVRQYKASEPADHNGMGHGLWIRDLQNAEYALGQRTSELSLLKSSAERHGPELNELDVSLKRNRADLQETSDKLKSDPLCKQ